MFRVAGSASAKALRQEPAWRAGAGGGGWSVPLQLNRVSTGRGMVRGGQGSGHTKEPGGTMEGLWRQELKSRRDEDHSGYCFGAKN